MGYTKFRAAGAPRAARSSHRNKGNAGPSSRGVAKIDEWITAPGGQWGRDPLQSWPARSRVSQRKRSRAQQEDRQAVGERLRSTSRTSRRSSRGSPRTKAELIFATTTPVPEGRGGGALLAMSSSTKRPRRARSCTRTAWAINDLHAYATPWFAKFATRPGNVHFKPEGSKRPRGAGRACDSGARARAARTPASSACGRRARSRAGSRRASCATSGLAMSSSRCMSSSPTCTRRAIDGLRSSFFFGGGWNGGSPAQFYAHCDYLAGRGIVRDLGGVIASRRGMARRRFDCVCRRQVRAALRSRTRTRARHRPRSHRSGRRLSRRPRPRQPSRRPRVFEEQGHSISSKPNALVLFNAVYDNGPGGYGHKRVKARWKQISPLHNLSKAMPANDRLPRHQGSPHSGRDRQNASATRCASSTSAASSSSTTAAHTASSTTAAAMAPTTATASGVWTAFSLRLAFSKASRRCGQR